MVNRLLRKSRKTNPKFLSGNFFFQKCNPPDFNFYPSKLTDKKFPHHKFIVMPRTSLAGYGKVMKHKNDLFVFTFLSFYDVFELLCIDSVCFKSKNV